MSTSQSPDGTGLGSGTSSIHDPPPSHEAQAGLGQLNPPWLQASTRPSSPTAMKVSPVAPTPTTTGSVNANAGRTVLASPGPRSPLHPARRTNASAATSQG